MLFVRAFVLEILICLHVLGGAHLFHRFFPRESPWWGFFIPTLAFVTILNFIEHFVPLPNLVWLLPFTLGGSLWFLAHPQAAWKRLWFPSLLFVGAFTFTLAIKCLQPDVNFYNTEGLTDLSRIVDFTLGDKLPPQDSWLPPYPHDGYYTFMHYGASVLKRLLFIDVGTAYNVGTALLNSLELMVCAAVGYSLSNYRRWVAVLMLIVVAGGFTGSTPIKELIHPSTTNPATSIDLCNQWDQPQYNEFSSLLRYWPPRDSYRLYTPGCYIYYSEFHATMAGHFLDLLTVFGVVEVLRRRRTVVPWVFLAVAPILTVISCPWFFIIVTLLAGPTLILAWLTHRRPWSIQHVLLGTFGTWGLLWPTLGTFAQGSIYQELLWLQLQFVKNDIVMIVIQYWPIYVPWIALCFAWKRFSLAGRWLYLLLVPIFILTEFTYFTNRPTTLEKTLGGCFGIGMVAFYPLLFIQRSYFYRALSGLIVLAAAISLWGWTRSAYNGTDWSGSFMHLQGDHYMQEVPQLRHMEEVLRRLRGQTVLIGKNTVAWFESPSLPAFTENRSFVGWTNAEDSCGHHDEAHPRADDTNAFYNGTMPDPLLFLKANDIAAILVWPGDKMSDDWLAKMKTQLAPDFLYYDCKGTDPDSPDNAGVFIRASAPKNKSGLP